ncbi:hypothetical protein PFAG_00849 [Plasmodium falciparum Santa Lucia]|uniref:Uncharacterized protein n=3 Tax=Plasmodium falciparum TaxID=5833 RepID=A0A024WDE5_PLAFA|nr:hypothetical protein PFTANZ_00993 [Plasmodium falciparum Tanzania (2000708)]ETW44419.1 hypothetical protein PFNF135_00986 [Plasmodium falciparum NF135/5.C10]EUT91022.1 hypothetical protein PFAG_00849 [Plasmodium falciparum Santa Lucia]
MEIPYHINFLFMKKNEVYDVQYKNYYEKYMYYKICCAEYLIYFLLNNIRNNKNIKITNLRLTYGCIIFYKYNNNY